MSKRAMVLVLLQSYLPGYKSGGPIRSIANMVDQLGAEFDFRIVTSDRDALDIRSYPSVKVDEWNAAGNAQVYYASPRSQSIRGLSRLVRNTPHDVLYLNSFFNPTYCMKPLLARALGMIPRRPLILAPRGEFSPGALSLKAWKKQPYRHFVRIFGICRGATWHASNQQEAEYIRDAMGSQAERIMIASNMPPCAELLSGLGNCGSPEGVLRIVFLSRITRMKNLDYALRLLSKTTRRVDFSVAGPIRDDEYWNHCQEIIATLPGNVTVSYLGTVDPSRVTEVLSAHDLFILPTRGENYGHVILESLSSGTPVLISDKTPWRDLETQGIGWDLPLDGPDAFLEVIERCADMSAEDRLEWRAEVRAWAQQQLANAATLEANRRLFESVCQGAGNGAETA